MQGKTKRDWRYRRAEILKSMEEVMGSLPGMEKRCPLNVEVIEEVDCGSFIRRLIHYSSEPNSRVPAYLLIPKKALQKNEKVRAVLCLHPTDVQLGHKVVVGLGGKENRDYGRELAERGYVVVAIDYRHAPAWKWPEQIVDVRTAMYWLSEEAQTFGGDTSRVVLVGRSAGAQLAMRLAYQEGPSSIRGVVNLYGPVDLAEG